MTSQREVKFRKWYDKFKDDNQVTFGLASEFNECWQAAQADQGNAVRAISLVADAREAALENEIAQLELDKQKLRLYLKQLGDAAQRQGITITIDGDDYRKALGETK